MNHETRLVWCSQQCAPRHALWPTLQRNMLMIQFCPTPLRTSSYELSEPGIVFAEII